YNDLPHLLTPVINDARTAAIALNWAVDEMERRYKLFADNRARDIKSFNEKVSSDDNLESLPCIVIIIDELADLMMASSQEVETSIQRLTAKARAAGIHLIVATQRPTTDVVKGTIKANINTRIAFRVSSYVDSITILDQAGAEQLLGKGDMLLKSVDRPMRLQGAYIKDSEIEKLTDFIKAQLEPEYLFTHDKLKERETLKKSQEKDELFFEVAKFVVEQDSCSINSIQQQFNLGFNRAQKIVESLENEEIVSVGEKNKARTVLITMSDLERFNDL
ncbi:MAG: FtsK/SpoIIIE domain-containing protein, partial [Acholeplasmataceae bacterium]|nr:FtsK/SpoIIIE domain-containing protein [Acholeplasmataceae bacterium]